MAGPGVGKTPRAGRIHVDPLQLGPDDPLPGRPHRVAVNGTSGSGKSVLAALLARLLQAPYIEMDSLFHGPGWTQLDSFESDVRAFTARPRWVTEFLYPQVRPLVTARLDLLVWLDLPRSVVLRQVVRRTLVRRLTREQLWHGNVEPPLHTFFTDPEHIVRWAWRTHGANAARVAEAQLLRPDLPVVRLRSHAEVRRWLAGPLMTAAYPGAQHVR